MNAKSVLRNLAAAAAWTCALAGFVSQAAAQNLHKPGEIRYVKGRILVQPKPGLTLPELDNKLKAHGGRRIGAINKIDVHVIELPSRASERAVAALLRSDRHIQFAEVDEQLPPAFTPNDPNFRNGWHLPKIGAPQAWETSDGDGVVIAILDSGVDAKHPDLQANLVAGYNAYDRNTDTRDVYGHGTKVAGAAAMAGNNLVGGTGVAFNSAIMPIRVTDTAGYGYFSTMASGLIWAADNGARVASMSFLNVCKSSTVISAAQYMRDKGGVVTGAAGNTGVQEPIAQSASVTCVSAVDSSDTKTSWSSFGSYVDVAAPGVGIYTTTNGGGYGSVSGTSFSAPITAAVYALMMSANPRLTPDELDAALFGSAVDLGAAGQDAYYGHGRIDAASAIAYAGAAPPPAGDTAEPSVEITSPADGTAVNGLVAVTVSGTDNVGITRVDLYAGQTLVGSATAAPYGFSWDTSGLADGPVGLEAKAYDAAGNVGSASVTVALGSDTLAPTVEIANPQSGAIVSGPITISANATDDKRVAKVSLTIDGKEVALSYGSSASYQWDPYGALKAKGQRRKASGTHTIRATATDDTGNARSASVSVTVP